MASKAATLGDPRRPQEVRKVSVPAAVPDEVTSSYILMMALTCGVSGLMFQSKLLVWAGLFTAMAGYTHMPFEAPDAARMMMLVFTMTAWSFVQVYFRPLLGMAPRTAHSPQPPPNTLHDD